MNQDQGKILPLLVDLTLPIPPISMMRIKRALGNPDRKGSPLTAEESAATEKTMDGWPTITLYERTQIKGIWFIVTRMKPGSGRIGLRMMTTEEVRSEGLKEYDRG